MSDATKVTSLPDGSVTIEISEATAAKLEQQRLPGESDGDLLRRLLDYVSDGQHRAATLPRSKK